MAFPPNQQPDGLQIVLREATSESLLLGKVVGIVHGCEVGDNSLIGINSVILNHVKIGKNCIIGANSLIPEGKVIPDNSMVLGSPGKVVKQLSDEQVAGLKASAAHYVNNFKRYKAQLVLDE